MPTIQDEEERLRLKALFPEPEENKLKISTVYGGSILITIVRLIHPKHPLQHKIIDFEYRIF